MIFVMVSLVKGFAGRLVCFFGLSCGLLVVVGSGKGAAVFVTVSLSSDPRWLELVVQLDSLDSTEEESRGTWFSSGTDDSELDSGIPFDRSCCLSCSSRFHSRQEMFSSL